MIEGVDFVIEAEEMEQDGEWQKSEASPPVAEAIPKSVVGYVMISFVPAAISSNNEVKMI